MMSPSSRNTLGETMRTRITAAAILLALSGLTACSSTDGDDKPSPTVTATVTESPKLSKAEQTQLCVAAVADVISARPDDFDPEADEDPKPEECNSLSDSEYLDAYMDGLAESNERAREALGG